MCKYTTYLIPVFICCGVFFPDLLRPVLRGNQSLQEPAHILRRNSGDVQRQKETWDAPSHLCHHRHSLQEYDARWVLTEIMTLVEITNQGCSQNTVGEQQLAVIKRHRCPLCPCLQTPDAYLVPAFVFRWIAFSCSSGLKNLTKSLARAKLDIKNRLAWMHSVQRSRQGELR